MKEEVSFYAGDEVTWGDRFTPPDDERARGDQFIIISVISVPGHDTAPNRVAHHQWVTIATPDGTAVADRHGRPYRYSGAWFRKL